MKHILLFILCCSVCLGSESYNRYTTDSADVDAHHSFSGAFSDNLVTPTDVTITTAATFYKIPLDTVLFQSGAGYAVFNDANDSIDIAMPGTYFLFFGISMSATAGAILDIRAHKNETPCNCVTQRKIGLQTDIGAASGMTIFEAVADDQISLRVTSDDDGDVVSARAHRLSYLKLRTTSTTCHYLTNSSII